MIAASAVGGGGAKQQCNEICTVEMQIATQATPASRWVCASAQSACSGARSPAEACTARISTICCSRRPRLATSTRATACSAGRVRRSGGQAWAAAWRRQPTGSGRPGHRRCNRSARCCPVQVGGAPRTCAWLCDSARATCCGTASASPTAAMIAEASAVQASQPRAKFSPAAAAASGATDAV